METIWEDEPDYRRESSRVESKPLSEKLRDLESQLDILKREKEAKANTKSFKFPFRWIWRLNASKKKANLEKILVLFLNKKNEIETPTFVPVFSGNIIIYRNKAYEFDPRGIWRMKGVKGYPSVYLIREIDRRPLTNPKTGKLVKDKDGRIIYSKDAAVSNMDIDEVRARGDSTESDEFLIKAALKAYTAQKTSKPVNWIVIGVVILVVCVGAFYLLRSNIGS